MPLEVRDRRVLGLLDACTELELLASGLVFAEGPVWVPDGGYLLFSDTPASRRLRWDEARGLREVAAETGLGNGMTLDGGGRLLVCEGETRCVARMDARGDGEGREVVAERFRGARLNSPNDVIVHSDGSVYFTDSWWPNRLGRSLVQEFGFQGVFRVPVGGAPELLLDHLDFPNGLCFSPDESLLYVNDSTPGRIEVYDVGGEGSLSNGRTFADGLRDETGHVDGMKCDERGNVWVTGPGGVWIVDAGGVHLGVLPTPERTGNIHWGGPDWSWLFLACSSCVYRVRTNVVGRREPFMSST